MTVTASYELDGQTVSSQRKWKIVKGGSSLCDDELPVYDWLDESDETDTETTAQTEPDSEAETATLPETAAVTEPVSETDAPASSVSGCGSILDGAILAVALPTAAILLGARRRRRKGN